jgi:hypothetical protein
MLEHRRSLADRQKDTSAPKYYHAAEVLLSTTELQPTTTVDSTNGKRPNVTYDDFEKMDNPIHHLWGLPNVKILSTSATIEGGMEKEFSHLMVQIGEKVVFYLRPVTNPKDSDKSTGAKNYINKLGNASYNPVDITSVIYAAMDKAGDVIGKMFQVDFPYVYKAKVEGADTSLTAVYIAMCLKCASVSRGREQNTTTDPVGIDWCLYKTYGHTDICAVEYEEVTHVMVISKPTIKPTDVEDSDTYRFAHPNSAAQRPQGKPVQRAQPRPPTAPTTPAPDMSSVEVFPPLRSPQKTASVAKRPPSSSEKKPVQQTAPTTPASNELNDKEYPPLGSSHKTVPTHTAETPLNTYVYYGHTVMHIE